MPKFGEHAAKAKAKAKAEASSPEKKKDLPKLLILTGTASGDRIMRMQMGRFFKAAEEKFECFVYEGEKECSNPEAMEIMSKYFKGSPMKMYDELVFDERNWRCYSNIEDTLDRMQAVMKAEGPFEGVLGFSQGANFAVMLAGMAYAGAGAPLKFVVPLCPNAPGYSDQVRKYFRDPIQVPSMIIRGKDERYDEGMQKTLDGKDIENDDEPVVSQHVVKLFKDPETFEHPDGHRPLPAKPKEQDALVEKIIAFMLEKMKLPPVVRPQKASKLPLWRVPEGSGGRVVRTACRRESIEKMDTLRPGSLVEQLELNGNRLHYHLLAGSGPKTGWVSVKSAKGPLVVRAPDNALGEDGEIWILTIGTRGDLQPFVVLAMALREAGYSVRLFGPPELISFCQGTDLKFTEVCRGWSDRSQAGTQVKTLEEEMAAHADDGAETKDAAEGDNDDEGDFGPPSPSNGANGQPTETEEQKRGRENFFRFCRSLGVDTDNGGDVSNLAWMWTEMPKAISVLRDAMDEGKPDLVIYNHLMVSMGLLMWRLYGTRAIFANLGLEFHFAPRGEDVFNFRTLSAFDHHVVKPWTGVTPLASLTNEEFTELYNSPDRLLGTTKLIIHVLPHDDQVVARTWKFTGFWIYEEQKQKDDPQAFGGPKVLQQLTAFLEEGATPVYMGWGSMPTTPELLPILIRSLKNLRLRAVMVRGWGNLTMESLQAAAEADPVLCEGLCEYAKSNVLFLDKAPHEWLLPRCVCSVHHGGAGTTAAAMRAGVPTIVVPLGYDQPVHGDWVKKLGVGVKCSLMKELQHEEFEEALRKASTDSDMAGKARQISETLQSEPGVSAAVDKIRNIMRDDVRTGYAQARWQKEDELLLKKNPRLALRRRWEAEQLAHKRRQREEAKRLEEERLAEEEFLRQNPEIARQREEERKRREEEAERQRQEEIERKKREEEERLKREAEERERKQREEEERLKREEEARIKREEEERKRREEEEERRRLEEEQRRQAEEARKKKEEEERIREEERKRQEEERVREQERQVREFLEKHPVLTIYIDRALEITTSLDLRQGMTALDVKVELAKDDPTGQTKPQDFNLLDPSSGRALGDAELVAGAFAELEVSVLNA